MLKKSDRLHGNSRFLKVSVAKQPRRTNPKTLKGWGVLAISALLMTLLSSLFGPLDLLAAPLIPTANTWMNYSSTTNTPPSARTRHMGAWDPIDNVMLMHGGFDDIVYSLNDTWKLDPSTGTWTKYNTPAGPTPPTRVNGCGVWDDQHNQLLIFGGHNYTAPASPMNVVWSFDPTGNGTWKQFTAAGGPPDGQEAQACVWDSTNKKMLVYGGIADDGVRVFTPGAGTTGTWDDLTTSVNSCGSTGPATPGARRYTSYVWNPVQNVMMIWGGQDQCSPNPYYNDVWTFSPNYAGHSGTWTKLTTTGGPPLPRDRAAMVWDPTINQMTIFGSTHDNTNGTTNYYNDVWSFKQTSTTAGQWSQRTPSGTAPSVRSDDLGVYDPIHNQILYFAGRIPDPQSEVRIDELWALGPAPTQFGLSFASAPFTITAGGTSPNLTINLTDPTSGNPTTNSTGSAITVNLSTSSNAGSFTPTSVTIPNGASVSGAFTYTDTKAGSPTLTGAAPSLSSTNAVQVETVNPGAANKLIFSTQPSTPTNAGVAFATQPKVTVQDIYNNTVTTAGIAITLNLTGGDPTATIGGTNPVNTAATGVASFTGLSVSKGSGTAYQLMASSPGLTSATSNNFMINITCNAASLTVNTLAEGAGDTCNVTLRQAVGKAAAGSTIDFAPGLLTTTVTDTLKVISLTSALPALAAGVKIDAGCDTVSLPQPQGNRGRPRIAIDGTNAGAGVSGFSLSAGTSTTAPGNGNTLKGLAIVNFKGYGIDISSAGNTITCSYIGTDDGFSLKANLLGGIRITGVAAQGAQGATAINSIGVTGAATGGNLIIGVGGGTSQPAIKADGLGAKNYLYHNYINYNATGTAALTGAQASTVTPIKFTNMARLSFQQGNKERR